MRIDKSNLSDRLVEKQKLKGTYDSPCMSICDYEGEQLQCQTCGMQKAEKASWKVADSSEKEAILNDIMARIGKI